MTDIDLTKEESEVEKLYKYRITVEYLGGQVPRKFESKWQYDKTQDEVDEITIFCQNATEYGVDYFMLEDHYSEKIYFNGEMIKKSVLSVMVLDNV